MITRIQPPALPGFQRRRFSWLQVSRTAWSLLLLLGLGSSFPLTAAPRPNFIIIFCDDLGYGDLGCYGHPSIRTPNLDRMASEGMRFTDFYSAAPVCTPSRAALLTGRYPIRSGMCGDTRRVLFPNSAGGLPENELTLAEALKEQGYATGIIGKWHLGHLPQYSPLRHGFDFRFGLPYSNDMDRRPTAKGGAASLHPEVDWWNVPLWRNDEIVERPADQRTLTKRYTEEAVRFIRDHREERFFLYLPHSMPHVPLFRSEKFVEVSPRGLYGDVVEEIDWSMGQILGTLRELALDRNTLVFFTSDNGPWLTQRLAGGSAGLLREGKGSTWEGGMREPAIAWWPGHIAGGQVTRSLACTMDLYTTFLALAGGTLPPDREVDGVDLSDLLLGKSEGQRKVFFYYRGTRLYAVRKGAYKAHYLTQSAYGPDKPEPHDPPLLFQLEQDPSERFDIAKGHPDVLADIEHEVAAHRAKLIPGKPQLDEVLK